MIRTIKNGYAYINDREACKNTILCGFLCTLANSRDILAWDNPSFNFINKGKTLARLTRFDPQPAITILTTTTGLTHKLALDLNRFSDRFTVSDLRSSDVTLDLELTLHAIYNDLQMQFTHAGKNGLAGFFICSDAH